MNLQLTIVFRTHAHNVMSLTAERKSFTTPLPTVILLGYHTFPILSVATNVPTLFVDAIYLLSFTKVNKYSTKIKMKV